MRSKFCIIRLLISVMVKKKLYVGGVFVYKRGLLLVLSLLVGILLVIPVSGQENLYRVAVLPFDDGSIDDHWWGITISGAGWLTYWLLPCSILNRKSSVLLNGTRSIGYWKNRTSAPRTGLMPDLPLPSGKFLAFSLSSSERLRSLVTKLPAVPFHWGEGARP